MSEIPDDIIKTAGRLVDLTIRNYEKEVFANVSRDHVAAAILAERQRCADVARHLNGWGPVGGHRVAEHIAHTILNP